mgnify:CR=1 FL=1
MELAELEIPDIKKHNKGFNGEGLHTDQAIKFCTKCKTCWEILMSEYSFQKEMYKTYNMVYYQDFPSYGKEKRDCARCLNQKVIKTIRRTK